MIEKIGLLLPRSVLYPTMSFNIVGGLKQSLAAANVNGVEIRTENIGLCSDDKLIYAQCEKMLFDGILVVAGYVNAATAEKINSLFAAANGIFIALDAGMHFPLSTGKLSNVFTLSLQGALCAKVVAKHAALEGNDKFAFTCSFFDSGFRSGYGFTRSLVNEGGQITFNHITSLKRADFTIAPLANHLDNNSGEAVFIASCGDMTQDIFNGIGQYPVFEQHPVYVSSFTAEEDWLDKIPYPGMNMTACIPWARSLENEANAVFREQLNGKKVKVNVFSLLGWETGLLMSAIAAATGTDEAIQLLEGYSIESPRGTLTIDPQTHQANAPVYLASIVKSEDGNCALQPGGGYAHTDEERKRLEQDIDAAGGQFTSWVNAYPCLES